MVENYK
ncbi:hypothetical protein VTN00DRAFT_7466 [Thermoascus crustaceus]|jgi:hypothetical protein